MDQITSMLDRLSDLTDGEIAELEGLILSEFESIEKDEPTPQTVDAMTTLADSLDSVRAETTRRVEQGKELAKRAAEAASRVKGDDTAAAMKDEEETPAEDAMPAEEAVPGEEAAPVVPEAGPDAEPEATEPAPGEEPPAENEDPLKKKVPGLSTEDEATAETVSEDAVELSTEVEDDAELAKKKCKPKHAADGTEDGELAAEETAETALTVEEPIVADGSSETPEDSTTTDHTQEDAVTASGNTPQEEGVVVTPPADHLPTAKSHATMTITAGADIPGYGAGAELPDFYEVAKAFSKRLHTLRNVTASGVGEQHTVATINFDYPEDRRLSGDDASNWAKIAGVTSPEAITAAAGVCAPLTTQYDVNVYGVTDRPVRDALARFNADRGGVRLYGTPTLDTDAVGIWETDGAAAKTTGDASCVAPTEVMVDAVYSSLKFSNFTNRFFPEMVKANTDLALIQHARVAETNLLKGINAASTKVTFNAATTLRGGAARTILTVIDQAAQAQRRRHRLGTNTPLRAIIPTFVQDVMRADIALQAPGDGIEQLAVADSLIESWFRARQINVTWSIESVGANGAAIAAPSQADGVLAAFETAANFALYPEGSFLFLDGGTLDLGIVRDGTMVAANEYSTFVETFEAVAFQGAESLWVTISGLAVSGAAGDLVDLSASAGAGS